MRKSVAILLVVGSIVSVSWAEPPVSKPAVPPCDDTASTGKPPCTIDSDSLNQPPRTPQERGVIVPPDIPAEGLPGREPKPKEPVNNTPKPRDHTLKTN